MFKASSANTGGADGGGDVASGNVGGGAFRNFFAALRALRAASERKVPNWISGSISRTFLSWRNKKQKKC